MYRAAMAAILSELNRQGRIMVVESFELDAPKTRVWSPSSRAWKSASRPLIVTEEATENLYLSARNLPYVEVRDARAWIRLPSSAPTRSWSLPTRSRRSRSGWHERRQALQHHPCAARVRKDRSLQEVSNQYVFEVATDATKADIKVAVEKLFDVKVEA